MKICLIGMPRSRSSILLESLSIYYNIPLLKENPDSDQSMTDFLLETSKHKEGVIRFHPNNPVLDRKQNFEYLDLLNLEQYDKIFFTDRKNAIEYICSIVLAHTTDKFTYRATSDIITDITPMYFDYKKHSIHIMHYILGRLQMAFIKNYIKHKNIKAHIISLDYDDIPNFIDINYNNYISKEILSHIKTNYDYKKIFINYNEIEYYYNTLNKIINAGITQG